MIILSINIIMNLISDFKSFYLNQIFAKIIYSSDKLFNIFFYIQVNPNINIIRY